MKKRATFDVKVARFRPVNDRLMIWNIYSLFCLQFSLWRFFLWLFLNEEYVFFFQFFVFKFYEAFYAGLYGWEHLWQFCFIAVRK